MRMTKLIFCVSALAAMLAVAASADTIDTYNFTATTTRYYNSSTQTFGPAVTFTGTFSFDWNNETITTWSFDLSPLEGVEEQSTNNLVPTTIEPVDVDGNYTLDSENSYFNNQNSQQAFDFDANKGDGTYYNNISIDANVGSDLSFFLKSPLPTAEGVSVPFLSYPNGGSYSQCQSCSGATDYNAYFASGSVVIATPEPPSWTLAGGGMLLLGGLMFWSDRRQRAGC